MVFSEILEIISDFLMVSKFQQKMKAKNRLSTGDATYVCYEKI